MNTIWAHFQSQVCNILHQYYTGALSLWGVLGQKVALDTWELSIHHSSSVITQIFVTIAAKCNIQPSISAYI